MPCPLMKVARWLKGRSAVAVACLALLSSRGFGEEGPLEGNSRIVLVGDSITGLSRNAPQGFANLMEQAIRETSPGSQPLLVPLGGSGQSVESWQSIEEQSRTKETTLDVKGFGVKAELEKPADWLVIMLGMNDVLAPYIGETDADLELWITNYGKLVENLQQRAHPKNLALAGITLCTEDPLSPKNRLIDRMNERVRSLAKRINARYFATPEKEKEVLQMGRDVNPEFHVTYDFVHPNEAGHLSIAMAMLEGMGATKASQYLAGKKLKPLLETAAGKGSGISWETISATRKPGGREFVFQMRYHLSGTHSETKAGVQVVPPAEWQAIPQSVQGVSGEFKLIGVPDRLNNEFILRSAHAETRGQIPAPWLLTAGVIEKWDGETLDADKNRTEIDEQIEAGRNFTSGSDKNSHLGWRPYFSSVNYTGLNDPNSVDFAAITHAANFEAGYGVRWVYSGKDRTVNLKMKSRILAGNVHLRVWMNGACCYQGSITKEPNGIKVVETRLHQGWNALVFKASHRTWLWQFFIGLSGTDTDSLDDLRYSIQSPTPP